MCLRYNVILMVLVVELYVNVFCRDLLVQCSEFNSGLRMALLHIVTA